VLMRGGRRRRRWRLYRRIDADFVSSFTLVLELHDAVYQGVYRVIGSEANIAARMPFGATLAYDDIASDDAFTTVLLDTAVLWVAVATVAGGTNPFFVCHGMESSGDCDVGYADFCEALAMALFACVVLAALLLENDDFFTATVFNDLGGDRCTGKSRYTDVRLSTVVAEEDVAERY
jgi:hypothetical protein